jgi:F-type H+-transporting ATPase subunit delta
MSLNKTTIARPYAKAAFAIALQDATLTAWARLLQTAAAAIQDQRVIILLRDPRTSPEQRLNLLCDICAVALHEAGRNFFKLLALKHRLDILPEIAELFETYRIEHEKTARVEVISAAPLNTTEQQQLTQALHLRLQRAVTLDCRVDDTLLGGTIIKAGDWVIDDSIRSKLTRLNTVLTN